MKNSHYTALIVANSIAVCGTLLFAVETSKFLADSDRSQLPRQIDEAFWVLGAACVCFCQIPICIATGAALAVGGHTLPDWSRFILSLLWFFGLPMSAGLAAVCIVVGEVCTG